MAKKMLNKNMKNSNGFFKSALHYRVIEFLYDAKRPVEYRVLFSKINCSKDDLDKVLEDGLFTEIIDIINTSIEGGYTHYMVSDYGRRFLDFLSEDRGAHMPVPILKFIKTYGLDIRQVRTLVKKLMSKLAIDEHPADIEYYVKIDPEDGHPELTINLKIDEKRFESFEKLFEYKDDIIDEIKQQSITDDHTERMVWIEVNGVKDKYHCHDGVDLGINEATII